MLGLPLETIDGTLHKVAPKYATQPIRSISDHEKKLRRWIVQLKGDYGTRFNFENDCHLLPREAFGDFSFDDICKIKYSSGFTLDESMEKLFTNETRYEIVRKIMSSMWRWSYSHGTWNEIVDSHASLRNFALDIPEC